MTHGRRHMSTRATALATAVMLLLALGACSTPSSSTSSTPTTSQEQGSVAIFTPSDGMSINQHGALNTWSKFVPDLTKALESQGFIKKNVSATSADDFERQSRDIQDYVVNTLEQRNNQSKSAGSDTTIIVAPVYDAQVSTRQYGDYAGSAITWDASDESSDESSASSSDSTASDDMSSSSSASATSTDSSSSDSTTDTDAQSTRDESTDAESTEEITRAQSGERMVSSLKLAQDEGAHVILVSHTLQGFTPDVFVQMSTAKQIGIIQAQQMVSKLALDSVTADNPKTIEILLPYDATDKEGNTVSDSSFAQNAFAGIWKVLGPYITTGKVVSSSGSLTTSTTAQDWMPSAFEADKPEQIQHVLEGRLNMTAKTTTHTRIDGIIAMNDFVASGTSDALDELGYTGSSADINPSISISGIVDNIAGRKDLAKDKVPDPAKTQDTTTSNDDDDNESAESIEKVNARWPIITGYGAYLDTIPQIVNGKQWMTALENRQQLVSDIAQVCKRLDSGNALSSLPYIKKTSVNNTKVATVEEKLLTVSASNLKTTLIDPGYISLADAGL